MSDHMPDKEFVAYFKKNINNPFLRPGTMMNMERVYLDQKAKYENRIAELEQQLKDTGTMLTEITVQGPSDNRLVQSTVEDINIVLNKGQYND